MKTSIQNMKETVNASASKTLTYNLADNLGIYEIFVKFAAITKETSFTVDVETYWELARALQPLGIKGFTGGPSFEVLGYHIALEGK